MQGYFWLDDVSSTIPMPILIGWWLAINSSVEV